MKHNKLYEITVHPKTKIKYFYQKANTKNTLLQHNDEKKNSNNNSIISPAK